MRKNIRGGSTLWNSTLRTTIAALLPILIVAGCSSSESDGTNPGTGGEAGASGSGGSGGTATGGTGGAGGSGGSAAPDSAVPLCAVGEFACEGDKLQTCLEDGSGFHDVATCGPGMCDAIEGQCDNCEAGATTCVTEDQLEVCSQDGQELSTQTCAAPTPYCAGTACVECTAAEHCAPSTSECKVSACSVDGACGFSLIAAGTSCGQTGLGGSCDDAGNCTYCVPGEARCQGQSPEVCDAQGQWQLQSACAAATPYCQDGACVECRAVADCPVSSNPCQTSACSTSNECGFTPASQGTACPGGSCNGAGVCSVCTPGTATCNGETPLTCNASGLYETGVPCSGGTPKCNQNNGECVQCLNVSDCAPSSNPCLVTTCVGNACGIANVPQGTACPSGTCNGSGQCWECAPGSTRCKAGTANVLQQCSNAGVWTDSSACPFVCEDLGASAQCGGACVPDSLRCDPNSPKVPQTCSTTGSWVSGAACSFVCESGGCTGVCNPGSRQCKSGGAEVPELCDSAGQWQDQTPCSGGTPLCMDGVCQSCFASTSALHKKAMGKANAAASSKWNLGSQMSVEFWLKYNSLTETYPRSSEMAVGTNDNQGTNDRWYCDVVPFITTNYPAEKPLSMGIRYTSARVSADYSFVAGTWYHVACQYDGSMGRLFVNGQLVGSAALTGAVGYTAGDPLTVTAWDNTYYNWSDGDYLVREVRIGNQALYAATFVPAWNLSPAAGTVALYHMQEGSGTTLLDATGGAPAITFSTSVFDWSTTGLYCP